MQRQHKKKKKKRKKKKKHERNRETERDECFRKPKEMAIDNREMAGLCGSPSAHANKEGFICIGNQPLDVDLS